MINQQRVPFQNAELLICPLCQASLIQQEQRLVCHQNHCFDMAKQGYVNLLPVQQKRSKFPGDDKAMVMARKHFLNGGYYQPLADKLAQLITHQAINPAHIDTRNKSFRFLDAGCGEGYYSVTIAEQLNNAGITDQLQMYGIDISKPAIIEACKRHSSIHWLVATLKNIPLQRQSLDAILSVFSPLQSKALADKLAPAGCLLAVTPGNRHLLSLKEKLYDDVKPFDENKPIAQLSSDWQLQHKESLSFQFHLSSQEQIKSLLTMTPHTWRISPARKARVNTLNELSCEADFLITQWQKKHHE